MSLLSKLFGSKEAAKNGAAEQEVEVRFAYGSTNFQYVYALGDEIQLAVAEAKVGEYDGHALPADGSEGQLFSFSGTGFSLWGSVNSTQASGGNLRSRQRGPTARATELARMVPARFKCNPTG